MPARYVHRRCFAANPPLYRSRPSGWIRPHARPSVRTPAPARRPAAPSRFGAVCLLDVLRVAAIPEPPNLSAVCMTGRSTPATRQTLSLPLVRHPVAQLALALALFATACRPKTPDAAPVPGKEDYAVYRAVLRHEAASWELGAVVLARKTVPPWPMTPPGTCREDSACRDWDLATHFRPLPPAFLENRFGLSLPVSLLDERERTQVLRCKEPDASPEKADWPCFWRTHPNAMGVFDVSRVAFDNAHTRALVYVKFHCGYDCGRGTVYLLEDGREGWHVIAETLVQMS